MVLKSDRLFLRPMSPEDAEIIVRWRNSKHVASASRLSVAVKLSLKQHRKWFTRTRNDRIDYIIILTEDNQPIGSLSFTWRKIPGLDRCAELGKFIGEKKALGQGFATEATRLWLNYGFTKLKLESVIARTNINNLANIKINQKMGFTIRPLPKAFGETSNEWICMQLTRLQWEKHI